METEAHLSMLGPMLCGHLLRKGDRELMDLLQSPPFATGTELFEEDSGSGVNE